MNNLLYLITIILVVIWATGLFVYNAGGLIHILLIVAVATMLMRIITGQKINLV